MANDHNPSEPTHAEIAARAYELWEQRGRPATDGAHDWQQAVAELTRTATLPLRAKRPLRKLFRRFRRKAA